MFRSTSPWLIAPLALLLALCVAMLIHGLVNAAPASIIAGSTGFAALGASVSSLYQYKKNTKKAAK